MLIFGCNIPSSPDSHLVIQATHQLVLHLAYCSFAYKRIRVGQLEALAGVTSNIQSFSCDWLIKTLKYCGKVAVASTAEKNNNCLNDERYRDQMGNQTSASVSQGGNHLLTAVS